LIHDLSIDKNEIEVLVFVSQTVDYFLPATGIILQERLGLNKNTMAFDIMLGCSGYVYGLSVISTLISTGKFKKGLLLAGDKSTFSVSKKDKSTYPLFSDAGTATLIEYDEHAALMDFNLQSDGAGYKAIHIPEGGTRVRWNENTLKPIEIEKGIIRNKSNLWLDGVEVFNFSLREAAPNVQNLINYNNTTIDDYHYFIFHQANKLMNESIRKKLKLAPEKVPYSLKDFGNTSSASIPLTMVTQLQDKNLANHNFIFSAFGVGLSWASCAIKNTHIQLLPLLEI
jgi:3-oxoacyl-[acyl-carrier-protein] synthase-3